MVQEILYRRQEPWRWEAQWPAIRSWQRPTESNHRSWSSYSYQRTQRQPLYGHSAFAANWEGERPQQVGTSWADRKSKNNHPFEVSSALILHNSNETCLSWIVQQKVDFIWQLVITSSVVGPRRSSKALPKTKLHQRKKKGMVTVWWSAAHYSLLNPSKPLHLRSMFSKSMRRTKNCNACS